MLKAGFIGMGRMGITHYSILNCHPSVRIVAVCDQSKLMLKLFKKYLDVLTFTDYEKMLEECEFDFVVISTPSSSHAEIAEAAINHNIHTFVEKPFTLNLTSGKETIKHLEGKELVNQVGYVSRFHDVFLQVKRLLDADLICFVRILSIRNNYLTELSKENFVRSIIKKGQQWCIYILEISILTARACPCPLNESSNLISTSKGLKGS